MLALCLMVLTASPAPLRVAVPNFSVIKIAPESAAFFMDRFANRLRARGLAVTTATEIETVLGFERQKSLLGCTETNCTAEIAAALGADAIVRARIARFGERFELTLTLIDPVNAAVLASSSASAADEGKVIDALDTGADELSAKLYAWKGVKPVAAAQVTSSPSSSAGRPLWVPLIPIAAGVAAGAFGTVRLVESFRKVPFIATTADPEALVAEAKLDRGLGIALLGVGVAGVTTGIILLIAGKEPVATPVAILTRDGAWVGLEGRLP